MSNQTGLLKVVLKRSELTVSDPTSLVREVEMCKFVVDKGPVIEAYLDKQLFVKKVAELTGREPTEEMLKMISQFMFGNL